jgi:probable F420-dependent oxidoreductase
VKLGVVFPQWAIKSDRLAFKDFAQTVEGMGYDYILLYEAIVDAKKPAGWQEPFALISYLAAVTSKIEFATGVVVLPTRQTALVAKQVAAVDFLSNGRLRFGIGIGGNNVEYQAMGVEMATRGEREEEQITVLRKLWEEDFVTFEGKYHKLEEAGIYPKPVQQPMPIWLGGGSDAVMRRIARMGDGWMMYGETPETAKAKMATLHSYIQEAGRKPEDVQLNIVGVDMSADKDWGQVVADWQAAGATYLDIAAVDTATWTSRFNTWDEYIGAVRRFKESVG